MSRWFDTLMVCGLATLLTACGGVNTDTSIAESNSGNAAMRFNDAASDDLQKIKNVSDCAGQPGSCQSGLRSYRF